MVEVINNIFGSTAWGIIAVFINIGLCGIACGIAMLSLKIFPPKKDK